MVSLTFLLTVVSVLGSALGQHDHGSSPKPPGKPAAPPKPAPVLDELTVTAPAGTINGFYARTSNATVRTFLGIPYAAAPVGKLRFAPPKKLPRFRNPVNATAYGPACYQASYQSPTGLSGNNTPVVLPPPLNESEDCLSVNVWAPTRKRLGGKKATVMLWIYGGGFMVGSSDTPLYSGANLVRDQEDVVVVSFNYRVNAFGFPASPALPAKQKNPGLLDVRAAVEWVRDNIAAFGGDPKKITLFGESAGGGAVDAYHYFSARDPIVRAAILQSGTINVVLDRILTNETATSQWEKLSASLNCTKPSDAATLACVRGVNATVLRSAIGKGQLVFAPTPDNGTIFSDTPARMEAGRFARIPILIGSNDAEVPSDPAQTQFAFTCPAARSAKAHAKYVPTWQYRYFGNFPSVSGDPSPGAFHGSEIGQVFGTFSPVTATEKQKESSKLIQSAWVAFAKDPVGGLVKLGWPKFDPEKETLVRLAYQNQAAFSYVDPAPFQDVCYA